MVYMGIVSRLILVLFQVFLFVCFVISVRFCACAAGGSSEKHFLTFFVVHYTNISTCHILLLLLTVPMYTMLSTTQISAHAISYCYCWLYPCTPCCPLHKYQHMPYLIAIVDCAHVHHVVHYTNISTCHILLLLLAVPMYTMLSTTQISAHAISYCYC